MTDSDAVPGPTRILFVCLGNICRSPLAEGVFEHLAVEAGLAGRFEVDSAGTGAWHVGEPPDSRSAEVARKHGIELSGRARRLTPEDLSEYDVIIAMDRDNVERIQDVRDSLGGSASIHLLREFDPDADEDAEVPDPYYGGRQGFDRVYEMVERSCRELLAHLSA